MFFLLYDFLRFMCEWMTFSWSSVETITQTQINEIIVENFFFDYDLAEQISTCQLVDSISPRLDYSMERYVTAEFISFHPYFVSHYDSVYGDYLKEYILRIGARLTEEEAYIQVLLSTLKKIHVLNYTPDQLDTLDYYILDWANKHMSLEEFESWKNDFAIPKCDQFKCIYFHVDVKIL